MYDKNMMTWPLIIQGGHCCLGNGNLPM